MTDLAVLRAACQRGKMPLINVLAQLVASKNGWSSPRPWLDSSLLIEQWVRGYYLDALAALQEALWPGSAVVVDLSARPPIRYMVELYHVGGGRLHAFACSAINHNIPLCPTLATAWLDAILAGIEAEAGHD